MESLEKNEVIRSQRDKPRHVPGEIIILMRQSARNNLSAKTLKKAERMKKGRPCVPVFSQLVKESASLRCD